MAAPGLERQSLTAAVLTVSDGVSTGTREDRAGAVMARALADLGLEVRDRRVVPDEADAIGEAIRSWCDGTGAVDVVVTLGGTGLGPRDVTPEATTPLITRPAPGLAEALRHEGARHTLAAYLSRGVAGLRGRTLVINVAGSEGAARDAAALFEQLLGHAAHVLRGGGHEPGEGERARRPAGADPSRPAEP